jgi:hypothetical protein
MIVRVPREQASNSSSSLVLSVQSYCSCQPTWRLRQPPDMCASRMQAPVSLADDGHLVRGEHKSHRRDEVRQQGQDITPPQPAFEGTIDTVVQRIVSGLTLYTECVRTRRRSRRRLTASVVTMAYVSAIGRGSHTSVCRVALLRERTPPVQVRDSNSGIMPIHSCSLSIRFCIIQSETL